MSLDFDTEISKLFCHVTVFAILCLQLHCKSVISGEKLCFFLNSVPVKSIVGMWHVLHCNRQSLEIMLCAKIFWYIQHGVCVQCFLLHTDINTCCSRRNIYLWFLTDNERTSFKAEGSLLLFFANKYIGIFPFLYGRSRLFLYVHRI